MLLHVPKNVPPSCQGLQSSIFFLLPHKVEMTGCLLLFTREKQASHNQNSCRILRLCPKVSDLPRVYWVVNELAGSTCTKPDKWAFLIALSRGIVFLVPNLRRAFHDEESRVNRVSSPPARDQYGSTHCGLWLSLPLGFVFAAKQTNFLPSNSGHSTRAQGHPASKPSRPQRIMQLSPPQYAPTRL